MLAAWELILPQILRRLSEVVFNTAFPDPTHLDIGLPLPALPVALGAGFTGNCAALASLQRLPVPAILSEAKVRSDRWPWAHRAASFASLSMTWQPDQGPIVTLARPVER